jgi:hypothetical protein
VTLRSPDALRDDVELAARDRKDREDLIGFAEIARAQDDRVGRIRPVDGGPRR